MLLLVLLMLIICSFIKMMGCSIEPGGAQITIFMIVGLITTTIIKTIFKRSAKEVYSEKRREEIEDEFMLSFEVLEIIGGVASLVIIIYAIASGVFMYRVFEYFETDKTCMIKPFIVLTISTIIIFINGYTSIGKKIIPVLLYIEADVLNKLIWLLAGLLLTAIVAGIYALLGMMILIAFFGNSIGGG